MDQNQTVPPLPDAYCDVVMKGGITSGVIYPMAAVELAKQYRFKNIGGTSAGAIAAAVVAASEFGRRSGNPRAFDTLAALPDSLADNGHLLALFAPDPSTRSIFRIALGLISPQGKASKAAHTFFGILLASPLASLAALAVSVTLAFGPCLLARREQGQLLQSLTAPEWVLCSLCALVLACLLSLLAAGVSGFFKTARALASNGFGMCSGMATQGGGGDSLAGWIHTQIQTAAGRASGPALTFGDLWNAPAYPNETVRTEHTIHLETVTTNLTQGRPYSMPFGQKIWFFDPDEMRRVLPGNVVDQMIAATPPAPAHPLPGETHFAVSSPLHPGKHLVKLPEAHDLPILLATRMSLSFPGLLSAVPLYIVDHSLERNQAKTQGDLEALGFKTLVGTKTWFSDGGICSNFPISFFDSPVPRWPTFGITLQPAPASVDDSDADLVSMSQPNHLAPLTWNNLGDPTWRPNRTVESRRPSDCIAGFANAIMNTMQNWRDNLQATAPGYRERIVTVKLRPDEGGLNLNMPKDLIDKLSARGGLAGQKLNTEFQLPAHMFIRFRIMLSALGDYLRQFEGSMSEPVPAEDNLGMEYIRAEKKPDYYNWRTDELRRRSIQATADLLKLVKSFETTPPGEADFSTGAPHPRSHLQNTPDF